MGHAKLVMIAIRNEITAQGVEQLLSRSRELTVVRARSQDERSLFQETQSTQPDVLITDDTDTRSWRPDIAALFEICPDLHIVLVSLKANYAHLLRRKQSYYHTETEFLKIIEGTVGD